MSRGKFRVTLKILVLSTLVIVITFCISKYAITKELKKEEFLHLDQINSLKEQIIEYEKELEEYKSNDILSEISDIMSQLNQFLEYSLQQYNHYTGIDRTYEYNILDSMLYSKPDIRTENYVRFDLAREIMPQLVNKKFYFCIQDNHLNDLLIIIDTHRMKIFVYEENKNDIFYSNFDGEAFANKLELEDFVESDWDDVYQEEYNKFLLEGWENLKIPDDFHYHQNLYAEVIYVLQRYCEENNINEVFEFDAEADIVSNVTNVAFVIKLQSNKRLLYMDIDSRRRKYHTYEVVNYESGY